MNSPYVIDAALMICIFEWKRESQLKCKKCFSSTGKRDQHWLEEEGSP